MPRKARIDAPGALHHIIVRGIERKAIFRDFEDYSNMLDRLETVLIETQTPCFAWALMPNHLHMLTRTGHVPVSAVMRRLLTGYAQQFNRRHHRHGPPFQNRFKSILCEQDLYSPKVNSARRSYAVFVAKGVELGHRPELTGGGVVRSVGGWSAFKSLRSKTQRLMGDERILGSSDFVETALALTGENDAHQTLAKAKGLTLNAGRHLYL